jgi:3-phosphoshikimate 1-carboxyvinyltransferase
MSWCTLAQKTNEVLKLAAPPGPLTAHVLLPSSKSISNRLLIIRELSTAPFRIDQLSDADDTRILADLLSENANLENCGHGGTTMRFLLALRCLQGHEGIITGSSRLRVRPIRPLVDTLKALGAAISYEEKEGFLPLRLGKSVLHGGEISIRADVSSQFISALLLIAPRLNAPLSLQLTGNVVSSSYIKMSIDLMRSFGADITTAANCIVVKPSQYTARDFAVPADWSAAAFFYAMVALRPGSQMTLPRLGKDQLQGDRRLIELMKDFGVETLVQEDDVIISGTGVLKENYSYDFTETPDLAQAFAVLAAVSNRPLHLSGLSTLKGKETDRLLALKIELEKAGAQLHITDDSLEVKTGIKISSLSQPTFNTYADHRMVMALSLLSLSGEQVTINEPEQVAKSFPTYFSELEKMGFQTVFK